MDNQQSTASKIGEVEKLKGLYRKATNLLNDPIKMKDMALSREAFNEACDAVQKRILKWNNQCIGRGSSPLLHRYHLSTADKRRQGIEDAQLREAEKIYRSKDAAYAKAVDCQQTEIKSILSDIDRCQCYLHSTIETYYHWAKDTLLAVNFEYFSKHYKSIEKKWFVGEISVAIERLNNIQYALEIKQQSDTAALPNTVQSSGKERENADIEIDSLTKKQQWRDVAPEYIPNADALKMAGDKIKAPYLSRLLRKQGNTIRWMYNKNKRRAKVHTQDFIAYLKNTGHSNPDSFSEAVFKGIEQRKAGISQRKLIPGN